jgi:GGDEF domain-containing protein
MAQRPRGLFKRLSEALFEEVKHDGTTPAADAPESEAAPETAGESDVEIDFLEPADEAVEPAPPPEVDLIAQMDEEAKAEAPRRSAVETAAAHAKFESRLNRVMQDRPQSIVGKMQMLDLDALRAQVGDRWQQVADRAAAIAQQVISHRLAPTDVFAPYEDNGFIMLFAELNEQQAKLKAAAIAREIREKLVGELGGEDRAWIKAFVCTVPELVTGTAPEEVLPTLDAALTKTPDVAPPPGSSQATDPELRKRVGEIGIIFRPSLFMARKLIAIYDCRAQRLDTLDRLYTGAFAYWRADPPMVFEIDRSALQLALRQVRVVAEMQPAPLIQVTLHAASLLAISGGQLVDLCRTLDPAFRRQLVIEIAGATIGTSVTPRLQDAVQLVQPFCRGVIARVRPGFTDIERLARYGFTSVGIDLDDPEVDIAPALLKIDVLPLARLASVAKLQSYLYGIKTPDVARAARAAGFSYLNGLAIAGEVMAPGKLEAFAGAV